MPSAGLTGEMRSPTPARADGGGGRPHHLAHQAHAVVDAAAPGILALGRCRLSGTGQQVTVGPGGFPPRQSRIAAHGARPGQSRPRCPAAPAPARHAGPGVAASRQRPWRHRPEKVLASAVSAEGATGAPPAGCRLVCETRPTCHSCAKIVPAWACTASVTPCQPASCFGLRTGRARRHSPGPVADGGAFREMMSPALARWS